MKKYLISLFLIFTYFSTCLYAAWEIQTVNGTSGGNSSMVLDSNNYPHIAYSGSIDDSIEYAKWAGSSWSIQTVGSAECPSIALDTNNFPHISYWDVDGLKYAKWTGSCWSIQTVDSDDVSDSTSIALDANNFPHISYHICGSKGDLKYAKWTGSDWLIQTVDAEKGKFFGWSNSIALDANNNPHIAYSSYEDSGIGEYSWNYDLKYAKWTGFSWSIQTVESEGDVGIYNSMAFDTNDKPHISYLDVVNADLKYAKWTGSSWSIQTIDSEGKVGEWGSIAIDSNNYPHVAYNDYSNDNLKYAKWTGSSWSIQTVDLEGKVGGGGRKAIALDTNNNPHISYHDATNCDLKYAKWTYKTTLSWTGEVNYTTDGLEPEIGTSTTTFIYRIKYIDTDNDVPKIGYPKIHIKKGGSEIFGSPFTMSEVNSNDTTYSDGKLYTYSTTLDVGNDYTYYFEAYDISRSSATGTPTAPRADPDVNNSSVFCRIKIPSNGKKISGNRVTVMAEIISGEITDVKEISFQYKQNSSEAWIDIPVANINHPNPDATHPYFIHWDVTGLIESMYNIRAVLRSKNNNYSTSETITIYVDKTDFDIEEKIVGNILQKRQKISDTEESIITLGDTENNSYIEVKIPTGAVITETIVKIENDIADPPEIKYFEKIQLCDIVFETDQTILQNNATAEITISYADDDNDSIIDGASIKEKDVSIFSYNSQHNFWERNNTAKINKTKKTCSVQVKHFSIYGLFKAVANNLDDILVYPNPYVPYDGQSDNGKPYSASDADSGIIFENITQSVKLEIYTVSGECVLDTYIDETTGRYQWNAKNGDGVDVATGIYFVVIKTPLTGQKQIKKIAIVR